MMNISYRLDNTYHGVDQNSNTGKDGVANATVVPKFTLNQAEILQEDDLNREEKKRRVSFK